MCFVFIGFFGPKGKGPQIGDFEKSIGRGAGTGAARNGGAGRSAGTGAGRLGLVGTQRPRQAPPFLSAPVPAPLPAPFWKSFLFFLEFLFFGLRGFPFFLGSFFHFFSRDFRFGNPLAIYRGLSGPPGPKRRKSLKKVPRESGKSLEKVFSGRFRDFFQTLETFSRLFADSRGPRGWRPQETFFRLFRGFGPGGPERPL